MRRRVGVGARTSPRRTGGSAPAAAWARRARRSRSSASASGSAAASAAVEERQPALLAERRDSATGQPRPLLGPDPGGHRGLQLPQAPGDRGGGQALRAAVAGEGVEEGVGCRVVALTGAAEHAGGRGEQDEVGEVELPGQLVQVPGGLGLGGEGRVDPRRDSAPRRWPSARTPAQWTTAPSGRSAGIDSSSASSRPRSETSQAAISTSQPSSSSSARSSGAPGAASPERLTRSRRRTPWQAARWRARSAAEAAGSAGEEQGAIGVERRLRLLLGCSVGGSRPRRQDPPLAQGQLGLRGEDERPLQGRLGGLAAVAVDQAEAIGVLGLGRAHQPPDGGGGGVGVGAAGGDRVLGQDRQPAPLSVGVCGEPPLHRLERRGGGAAASDGAVGFPIGGEAPELRLSCLAARRDLLPTQDEQAAALAPCPPQLLGRKLPQGERGDRRHRGSGGVGEGEGDLLGAEAADPHPQLGPGAAVQLHPGEGEGELQRSLPLLQQEGRLQRRVEQGGVDRPGGGGSPSGRAISA